MNKVKKCYSKIVTMGILPLYVCFLVSCQKPLVDNQLSAEELASGWKLLFDGTTLNGWHIYNQPDSVKNAWTVSDGSLYCLSDSELLRGDLVTDSEFENYELQFDWTIEDGGNSGIFINVDEQDDIPTAWASGPEYQLLGKGHHDESKPMKLSGCFYNFSPQSTATATKPAGEWNHSRIIQKNGNISFYLNGNLTAQQDMKSVDWPKKIKDAGFDKFAKFGQKTKGHFALQSWEKSARFKNIKILAL